MNRWRINTPDPQITDDLVRKTGLPAFVCRLLVSRGVTTSETADIFFNGVSFADPFDIKDMDKAVKTISAALENGEKITIYGDYDCDGVTSTYMLFSYLEALGAEVSWYIPTRDEGYGLNNAAADLLKKQCTKLIITVDNGISAINEAEYIRSLGMKLVITDHHQVPDELPQAEAVVDPHRRDDISQFKHLAGCGVALKLIMAMEGDTESVMTQFADIAAIGTVGDIVSLSGENRIIVREGLKSMRNTENPGLRCLLDMCGIEPGEEITSTQLGFQICPRINAAGRYSQPAAAMELFLSEDMRAARANASKLCALNDERKEAEKEIVDEAEKLIRDDPDLLNRKLLIVSGSEWKHGIIGLVSAKLLHKYGKPNIVITREGDVSRGSARSTDDLSLYELLCSCSGMLTHFGGHTKAAGFTLNTVRLDEFIRAVYDYCDEKIRSSCAETITADMELSPSDISVENIGLIENFEPFGEGNQAPLFLLRNCTISSRKPIKDGKYVSLGLKIGGKDHRAVCFGMTFAAFPYSEGDVVDLIARLEINEYNGSRNVNIFIQDLRYSGFREDRYFAAKTAYEDYRAGRVDRKLLCRMIPERDELMKVYDILRNTRSLSAAEMIADRSGINACKFRIITDVFGEFGLAETDLPGDGIRLLPAAGKADLSKSKVIAALKA